MNSVFLNQLFGNQAGVIGNDPSLNAFSRTIGQNDYWKLGGGALGSAKLDTSTWNPATTAAVTGAQGFLSALLSGYGTRQEAQQLDAVRAVLPQLRAGEDVALPDFVDPEAAAGLKLNIAQENADRQALRAAKEKELEISAAKVLYDKGMQVNPQTKKLEPVPGFAEALGGIEKAKEDAKWGTTDPLKNPASPQALGLKAIKDEEDARRTEITTKVPSIGKIQNIAALVPSLESLAKQDTKTSDIPFVYQFIQAQDGGVVKEGEQATVRGSSPLLQRYSAELEGALNGTSTITPARKQQMVNEMKLMVSSQLDALPKQVEKYLAIGEQRGASRANMMPFDVNEYKQMFGSTASALDPKSAALAELKRRGAIP